MTNTPEIAGPVSKERRRKSLPGGLSDVHNIESELVQRNREIAHVRDQLGQREAETTTWKKRHGEEVGKVTDLEGERSKLRVQVREREEDISKLRVQVRELCNRLEEGYEKHKALNTRAEQAEAKLLRQEADSKAHLEAERKSALKHAEDLAGQLASERSARLASEARLESLFVQQQTKQHRQWQGPQPRPQQRRESLPELRLELVSAAHSRKEYQEQRVAREKVSTAASSQTCQSPAAACTLTLAASDSSLLGILEGVEGLDMVRTGDGHDAVANAGGSASEKPRTDPGKDAVAHCSRNASPALPAAAAPPQATSASSLATRPAAAQIAARRPFGRPAAVAGTAAQPSQPQQPPSDEAELRVQLRLLQVEVGTLRQRLAEGLAMAAEDSLGYRNRSMEARAREGLMAAQLEESRRARSVELTALVKRMSQSGASGASAVTAVRPPMPPPVPLGGAAGGA